MARVEGIDAVMDKNHLDAMVAPTGGCRAWITDLVTGDHFSGGSSNAAAVASSQYQHHCGVYFRVAGRHFIFWSGLERTDADQDRLCIRTGNESQTNPEIPGKCKVREFRPKIDKTGAGGSL